MAHDLDEGTQVLRWPWPKRKADKWFRVNWLLLIIGFLLVAGAAVLEHPVLAENVPTNLDVPYVESVVFSQKSLIGLLKEIGFALIIAWAVSYLIERHAKKREHEAHEAARKQMASDVVHAVFGLQHSPAYVRKVVETTLQCKVVRKHYSVEYSIDPLTPEEVAALQTTTGRFVKFTQVSSYTFRNVSQGPVKHAIKYALPVRAGPAAFDFAGITTMRIDGKKFKGPALQRALVQPPDDYYKKYRGTGPFLLVAN